MSVKNDDVKAARQSRLQEITAILIRNQLVSGITPQKLRRTLEELGPTFVKLGQIMSMRSDMLPPEYCEELGHLRSEVAPLPFDVVKNTIEQSCHMTVEEMFSELEEQPLGSASIAQVHRAKLLDGGEVVVKVQRPGLKETLRSDIALLRKAAKLVRLSGATGELVDYDKLLDELWSVTQEEMDFLCEATNAEEFYTNCTGRKNVSCPYIYREYSTSQVLVMEYIDGYSVSDKDKIIENGMVPDEVGKRLAQSYVQQVIDDGFFHADPHQGNIRLRGEQLVWIDLGMMGRLSVRDRQLLTRAMMGVAQHDTAVVKEVIITLGYCKGRIDHSRLYTDIDDLLSQYAVADMGSFDIAKLFTDVARIAREHEIAIPSGVAMLGRGVATLQGVLADLCPEVSFIEIASTYVMRSYLRTVDWQGELTGGVSALFDSGRKSLSIPALISDMLKLGIKGQSRFGIEHNASEKMMLSLHCMLSRLCAVMVSAALFVSGSILCAADMQSRLWGVPPLAWLCFVGGAATAVWCFLMKKR